VDEPLEDGRVLLLGDADWQVIRTPGHTPGHLSLWQPEERLLVVGDALSDYDVGWVNLAVDCRPGSRPAPGRRPGRAGVVRRSANGVRGRRGQPRALLMF
jgi:hypothetical protein